MYSRQHEATAFTGKNSKLISSYPSALMHEDFGTMKHLLVSAAHSSCWFSFNRTRLRQMAIDIWTWIDRYISSAVVSFVLQQIIPSMTEIGDNSHFQAMACVQKTVLYVPTVFSEGVRSKREFELT